MARASAATRTPTASRAANRPAAHSAVVDRPVVTHSPRASSDRNFRPFSRERNGSGRACRGTAKILFSACWAACATFSTP
ncbi:hypothetical protein CF54_13490 [Streptomyces sp. Tu 6176]|nr:hypothetical protein CF54_13490 [Streptomyces sp. Tu 6176]